VSLFLWKPNLDQKFVLFVIAGLWGVADAIWQTQINGKVKNIIIVKLKEAKEKNSKIKSGEIKQ
jgi:hypothetical protein